MQAAIGMDGLIHANWVTQAKMASLTGLTEKALERKRQRGVLPEGATWALIDGRIMYSIQGYNQWVENQVTTSYHPASKSTEASSGSRSHGRANDAGNRSKLHRLRPQSKEQAIFVLK